MKKKERDPITPFRLPPLTRRQLKKLAALWGTSMAGVVRVAIQKAYVKELGKQIPGFLASDEKEGSK